MKRKIDGLARMRALDREVLPLNARESPLDTRKGMIKRAEVINIAWAEKQLPLYGPRDLVK